MMVSKEQIVAVKDRVKNHVSEHKTEYWIGSLVVVAGVTYIVLKRNPSLLGLNASTELNASASIIGINNKLDQRVIMLVDRKGPPSYVIGKRGTDEEWTSQALCALAEGIKESRLRAHLNGKVDSINGKQYFRKGLAAAEKVAKKRAA